MSTKRLTLILLIGTAAVVVALLVALAGVAVAHPMDDVTVTVDDDRATAAAAANEPTVEQQQQPPATSKQEEERSPRVPAENTRHWPARDVVFDEAAEDDFGMWPRQLANTLRRWANPALENIFDEDIEEDTGFGFGNNDYFWPSRHRNFFKGALDRMRRWNRNVDKMMQRALGRRTEEQQDSAPTALTERAPQGRSLGPVFGRTFSPRLDVKESDKEFEVHVDLPGVKKEELAISIQQETDPWTRLVHDVLVIEGSRKYERTEGQVPREMLAGEKRESIAPTEQTQQTEQTTTTAGQPQQEPASKPKYYRIERSVGSFKRRFVFPKRVVPNASAKIENGVLTVVVPKMEEQPEPSTVHKIAIE